MAVADQDSVIAQQIQGDPTAAVDQDSTIAQGETPPAGGAA
jgi:hypothetical protein